MLPNRNNNDRLAKTICLLDSPVAGERAAALEAVRRQLETLGLSWADIAPKVGAFDGDRGVGITKSRRPATTEMSLSNLCRWNECSQNPLAGSLFCTAHVADIIREPLENFLPFLKNLTRVVNNETAGNALYHAVHAAVHMGMFNSHVGHDLVRAARACRDGNGVAAVVEKLAAAIGAQEQGEFMMHVKRQLVVPERRSARRE